MINKDINMIGEGFVGLANTVKKKAYEGMATIEQKVDRVKVSEGLVKVMDGAKIIMGEISREAKELHDSVQQQGGYQAVGQEYADRLSNVVQARYDAIEEVLCTDGKFDQEKTQVFLNDKAEVVRSFGLEVYKSVSKFSIAAANDVKKDYRELVPSREELSGVYSGIGAAIPEKTLLRPELDAVLNFHGDAKKILPGGLKLRNDVLSDIKASSSTCAIDLSLFYTLQNDPNSIKGSLVSKYLE